MGTGRGLWAQGGSGVRGGSSGNREGLLGVFPSRQAAPGSRTLHSRVPSVCCWWAGLDGCGYHEAAAGPVWHAARPTGTCCSLVRVTGPRRSAACRYLAPPTPAAARESQSCVRLTAWLLPDL